MKRGNVSLAISLGVLLSATPIGCTMLLDPEKFGGAGATALDGDVPPDEAGVEGSTEEDDEPSPSDARVESPPDAHADTAPDVRVEAGGKDASVLPADPRSIACGTKTCQSPSFCCVQSGAVRCEVNSQECPGATEIHCDETQDCPGGQVCCVGPDTYATSVPSSLCATSCGAGYVRVCKSTTECASCTQQTCASRTMGMCGPKPGVCH